MNCLEFRRRMTIDPMSRDADLMEHESGCGECAQFARELRASEIRMRTLLRDVTPPEGLADRVRLAANLEQRAGTRRRWWYAAAASVLVAIGANMVSLWQTTLDRADDLLAESVIHHIEDESSHLRESGPVSASRVKWVFRRFGAELRDDIGPIHFAAECLMRSRNGVHLVLPGAVGPITVFFMPGETAATEMPVDSARFRGHIVPTAWGSIAVVGEREERLDGMGQRLAAAVDWPQNNNQAGSGAFGRGLAARSARGQQQDS